MFHYIKGCFLAGIERLFTFSFAVHSCDIRFSEVPHIPKGNTMQFDIKALSFDGAKVGNKFYFELNKENNFTKYKL